MSGKLRWIGEAKDQLCHIYRRDALSFGRKTYQLTKMDQDNAGIRSGQMAQGNAIHIYIYIHIHTYMCIQNMYDKGRQGSQEPGNGQ